MSADLWTSGYHPPDSGVNPMVWLWIEVENTSIEMLFLQPQSEALQRIDNLEEAGISTRWWIYRLGVHNHLGGWTNPSWKPRNRYHLTGWTNPSWNPRNR